MAQCDLFRPYKTPWNSGRIIGAKPPLKPRHTWAIRLQLKNARRIRDLALFNCAIDAKLRGGVGQVRFLHHVPLAEIAKCLLGGRCLP
jgi:hypothetical protein